MFFATAMIGLIIIFLFWTGIFTLALGILLRIKMKRHRFVSTIIIVIAGLCLIIPTFTAITTRIGSDVGSDYVDTGRMVTIRTDDSIRYNGKEYIDIGYPGAETGSAFSGRGISLNVPTDEDHIAFNVKRGFNWLTGIPLYVNTKENAYGIKSEWVDDQGLYVFHEKEEETMLYCSSDCLWCEDDIKDALLDYYDESYENWQWTLRDTETALKLTHEEEKEIWENDHELKGLTISDEACEETADLDMVSRDGVASQWFYVTYSKGEWYTPTRKLSKALSEKISRAYFGNK